LRTIQAFDFGLFELGIKH